MRRIVLKSIQLSGFKSFTREVEISFDLPGLTLISGDNQIEPRLGGNGVGKSSIFDALCFCLFGTSVKGARIGDLVSAGEKKLFVLVILEIEDQIVEIRRAGPPAVLTIDGNRVEQFELERLIGLSRSRWLNSVVFGQDVPLFVDFPVPQRGELLDEILNLQIWMKAADKASSEQSNLSKEINQLQTEIGRIEGALSSLQLEELVSLENNWEDNREKQILKLIDDFTDSEKELNSLLTIQSTIAEDVESLWEKFQFLQKFQEDHKRQLLSTRDKHDLVAEEIKVFEEAGDICPLCSQAIDRIFASNHLSKKEEELNEYLRRILKEEAHLEKAKQAAVEAYSVWKESSDKEKNNIREITRRESRIEYLKKDLDNLENQIKTLSEDKNPHTQVRIQAEERRKSLEEELSVKRGKEDNLKQYSVSLDFWKHGFRRVRLFCIRRVLMQLEVETMNAATQLGLISWKINFTTETETKSGSTRLGIQIAVTSPHMRGNWNSWSGGEGQRVRLCIALGLSNMIQRWAGVRWEFEVFDEPTAWLSTSGIEDLLELLKVRADTSGRCIFLCDHRALDCSGFDRILTVVKDENGSRLQ